VVIAAATLKEALRLARVRYGEDARVINSRTVVRRQQGGLGQERLVEVLIDPAESTERRPRGLTARLAPLGREMSPSADAALMAEIAREVGRIEEMVHTLSGAHEQMLHGDSDPRLGPVGEILRSAGASATTVASLITRFVSETGCDSDDHAALMAYLLEALPASNGSWEEMGGCHVFLGPAGCGKTEMLLAAAAELQAKGKNCLVLSLLPRSEGDIRRLQEDAAQHGFDAAILKKEGQLRSSVDHFARYDAVLIDTPGLFHTVLQGAGELQEYIVQNAIFHRHLIIPLDVDLHDCAPLWAAGRAWNCDWLALSRGDLSARFGKLLDMVEELPLPVSFLRQGPWPRGQLRIASSKLLVEMVVAAGKVARKKTSVAGTSVDGTSIAGAEG